MINELFYNALWDANHSIQKIMRTQESTSHNFISGFLVSPLWNTCGSSRQFSFSHSPEDTWILLRGMLWTCNNSLHNFSSFFWLQQLPKHIEMKIIKKKGCMTQMVHKTIKCCTCSLTTCSVLSGAFRSVRKALSCKFTHSYSYRTISNLLAPFRLGSCQTQLHIMLMT